MIEAYLLLFVFTLVTAYITHEIGHFVMLKSYTMDEVKIVLRKAKSDGYEMVVGERLQYLVLSSQQRLKVYLAGVLSGFVVVCFTALVVHWIYLVLLIPLVISSNNDLRNIRRCIKDIWHI